MPSLTATGEFGSRRKRQRLAPPWHWWYYISHYMTAWKVRRTYMSIWST